MTRYRPASGAALGAWRTATLPNARPCSKNRFPRSVLTAGGDLPDLPIAERTGSRYIRSGGPRWTRTTYLRVISTALCQLS